MSEDRQTWQELGLNVALHEQLLASIHGAFEQRVLSQKNRPQMMRYFDEVIHRAHGARVREIIERRKAGGKFVGTFCIYVPEEIVIALGGIPLALCGGTAFSIPYAEKVLPRDICPLIKSTLGLAFSDTCPFAPIKDLAVGETTCDAKKKTWDFLSGRTNFHVMEVPQKKEPIDHDLWRQEVLSFKTRLEQLTGNTLDSDNLSRAVRLLNRRRAALATLNAYRKSDVPPISGTDALVVTQGALTDDPQRFCENLDRLNEELEVRAASGVSVAPADAKRVMISGCPSVSGNWKLHHLIESSGAIVVCEETCTGTRYYENPVAETDGALDAQLHALADRYMKINCSCFSPNQERMAGILKLAKEYRVHGVVQYVLQYCHGYNVEALNVASTLKSEGVPSLKIETDYSEEDSGQLRTRIEAFLELPQ